MIIPLNQSITELVIMPKCLATSLGILNQQLVLVAVTISGILSSSAFLPLQLNDIYADDSETNTEQDLTQENIGSGESIKNNCAQNSIAGIVTLDCIGGDTPTPPISPNRFFTITTGATSVCSEFSSSFTILCYSQIPGEISSNLDPPFDHP